MDEVLLVASSRSFSAVNREQFYVSISRGRERVHVFTDDPDLLARRVTVSNERKAAVELQGLREELAKLGFLPPPPPTEPPRGIVPPHPRTMRPMRRTRATRLTPLQRLVQVAAKVGQWLNGNIGVQGRRGLGQKESIHHRNRPSNHPRAGERSHCVNH